MGYASMTSLKEYVDAEVENIQGILSTLPTDRLCSDLSVLELAGVAALIHNFYNGVENILKQVMRSKGIELPKGHAWHRDLIIKAVASSLISSETAEQLKPFLAFQHFFSHSYAVVLDASRLEPLMNQVNNVYDLLLVDLKIIL